MSTDNKKTPLQKLQAIGSREVSRRKTPINLNSTISSMVCPTSSAAKKYSVPANRSNHTLRSKLDVTSVGLPSSTLINPTFKSNLPAIYNTDHDLDCQLAYNEYLQALVKKQICQGEIEKHKEALDDQIVSHSEQLDQLKDTYGAFMKNTEELKIQGDIVEVANFLEENINEICQMCSDFSMLNKLNNLQTFLASACNFVTVKNMRKIKSQPEYDTFISTLILCVVVMEKILSSGRNVEKVHELAEIVRSTVNLKVNIETSQKLIINLEKTSAYLLLQFVSNIFARVFEH